MQRAWGGNEVVGTSVAGERHSVHSEVGGGARSHRASA